MSATERLRELLDERGVYWDYGITGASTTRFNVNGIDLTFTPMRGGLVCSTILTPEQAIEATLGAGTCHLVPYNENYATCSECGISLPRSHGGWWFYCPGCGCHLMGEKVVSE